MKNKIISVIGGSGFIGQYLVNYLLTKGFYVKILSRHAEIIKPKYTLSKLGQLALINCDIKQFKQIKNAIKGSEIVINLTGLLSETKNNSFEQVHNIGTKNIVNACQALGVTKLLHLSAIGASKSSNSIYARTKFLGENNISQFKNYIIIRPSIVYGDEDNFINYFAKLSKFSPFIPLIGGGKTKFQPIWVQDLVNVIGILLEKNGPKLVEVGGDEIISFKSIIIKINNELEQKRYLLNIPFGLSKKVAYLLEKIPNPILTKDQVELLKSDNVINRKYSYKKIIKYIPKPFDMMLEKQLIKYKKRGGHY